MFIVDGRGSEDSKLIAKFCVGETVNPVLNHGSDCFIRRKKFEGRTEVGISMPFAKRAVFGIDGTLREQTSFYRGLKPHPLRVARFELGSESTYKNKTTSVFLLSSSFVQPCLPHITVAYLISLVDILKFNLDSFITGSQCLYRHANIKE
ncbi:hypothetical protein WA1_36020 [Scytonema hofmannii PCC 7110]|uniref:Uncharacterized protein n=1 Tax=Scytonema hofmannii PCC 7110 TaxID=128403 RepID=A0A139X1Q7_9CYAN|nr:hypothetical protein WA1_36020 [Scytonema hofmannii PCC 7110]